MKVSIVVADGCVVVDGEAFRGIDLSFLPENTHAVQWSGDRGYVEIRTQDGWAVENRSIDSLDAYKPALDQWQARKAAYDVEQAAERALEEEQKQKEAERIEEQQRLNREAEERSANEKPDIDRLRRTDLRNEADPIFFKWQRGEATEQDWLDKVAEIRARYPKPE